MLTCAERHTDRQMDRPEKICSWPFDPHESVYNVRDTCKFFSPA